MGSPQARFRAAGREVHATGSYRGTTFSAFRLTVTTSAPAEVIEPLFEPARRVCYVSNTIAGGPPITVELRLAAGSDHASP